MLAGAAAAFVLVVVVAAVVAGIPMVDEEEGAGAAAGLLEVHAEEKIATIARDAARGYLIWFNRLCFLFMVTTLSL